MREDDDGGAAGEAFHVVFQPLELFAAKVTQATRFQVENIHKSDKMHTLHVEALPASALGSLAISFQVNRAVIGQDIMFTGNIEDPVRLGGFEQLIKSIEF